jgi:hypothetical protein
MDVVGMINRLFQAPNEQALYDELGDRAAQVFGSETSAGLRTTRIVNEVLMIAPYFSKHEGVSYDEENADWLMIPKYPLPARWRERWCSLLIIFPEMYPVAPPIGFYLNRQFQLKSGAQDPHLVGYGAYTAPDLRAHGWFWYCVKTADAAAGGWRASPDFRKPDNLWTYLTMIREVLSE